MKANVKNLSCLYPRKYIKFACCTHGIYGMEIIMLRYIYIRGKVKNMYKNLHDDTI